MICAEPEPGRSPVFGMVNYGGAERRLTPSGKAETERLFSRTEPRGQILQLASDFRSQFCLSLSRQQSRR